MAPSVAFSATMISDARATSQSSGPYVVDLSRMILRQRQKDVSEIIEINQYASHMLQ